MYDAASGVWQRLREGIERALPLCGIARGEVWKTFYSAQQRFFKILCISIKARRGGGAPGLGGLAVVAGGLMTAIERRRKAGRQGAVQ